MQDSTTQTAVSNAPPSASATQNSPTRLWVGVAIACCFFLSGLTSLALETAWTKSLSYLLGADLYGAATTIVAYMAGLGLGAILAVRWAVKLRPPLLVYAVLQLTIGLLGMVSVPALMGTSGLFEVLYRLSSHHVVFLTLRFLVTFLALLPATTLMGMTLPTIIGAHGLIRTSSPAAVGLLYGLNTLGAVCGTVLAGFFLVPRLGLTMTCVVAGGIDFALAAIAYALYRRSRVPKSSEPSVEKAQRYGFDAPIAAAVALSGVMALGLELSWFRLLGQVIGPTVQAFALTLAVFLTGVGLGSLVGARSLRWFPSGEAALLFFLVLGALFALGPAYLLGDIPDLYLTLWAKNVPDYPELSLALAQAATAAVLMLPATLATGAAFPAGVRAYRERVSENEPLPSVSGKLYFANTVGSAVGTLAWAFFLLPDFGVVGGIRLAAGTALVAALIVVATPCAEVSKTRWRKLQIATASGALVAVGFAWFVPTPDQKALNAGVFTTIRSAKNKNAWLAQPLHPKAKLLFWKDGINGSVAVVSNRYGNGAIDLALGGKWEASTQLSTRKSLLLLGHMPMLLSKKLPESSMVIGLGTGMTSGALLQYSAMKRVDIVEIESAVVEASTYFKDYNHEPLKDPRSHLVIQDGRTYLWFSDRKYDLITSDPIHPWVKGAANLYTQEYYARAKERMNPGGIFCQWIPSTMSVSSFHSILRTLHSAFPHVVFLFADREVVALAALEPIQYDLQSLESRMEPAVRKDLEAIRVGEPAKLMELLAKDLHPIERTRFAAARLNTDDNVFLEHQLPWDTFHGGVVQLRGDGQSKKK
jgi:spermidine synthase